MPQKKERSSNKKKNNKASRNTASSTCAQCAKPVPKANIIDCICTTVIYCSLECQEKSFSGQGRHQCSGPPKQVTNLQQMVREFSSESFKTSSDAEEWSQEHLRIVLKPCIEYRRQTGGVGAITADTYARDADQGHAPSAYMAGIQYKNRLLGEIKVNRHGDSESNNADAAEELGVLKTDRLAFKYLSQASEAGIGIAMQSLADCYENGQGCEKDMRMCGTWLMRAVLLNTANAYNMLESKNLIDVEHMAQYQHVDQTMHRLLPGQRAQMGGPNLSALILALSGSVVRNNYMLPAFAGAVPTGTVGNRPAQGTTGPVKILGAQLLKEIEDRRAFFRMQFPEISYVYGRRGTAKAATSLSLGEAFRSLDSAIYVVPLPPACDETPTNEEVFQWKKLARSPRQLMVHCLHTEASGRQEPWSVCDKCIEAALERMWAVSHGAVVLSAQEAIQSRGQTAIFRGRDGKIVSENFKSYARGEVECTLAALVAARDDFRGLHCHPLFAAQDPNLFWPLIHYHGSIRAALEFVAPHVEWDDLIGSVRQCPEALPLAKSGDTVLSPGGRMRKCGSDLCLNLEMIPNTFEVCGLCSRREYCSSECQRNDWRLHRLECKPASKGAKRELMPKEPVQTRENRVGTEPTVGEHVLVHGLQARPEFNGNLGEVTGERVQDRYPIKVSRQDIPLLIKPGNLHRLGIEIVKKPSEPMQFKCLMHGSTVCSQCCFDFKIANHLARSMGEPISREAIATIAETHFAAIKSDLDSGETWSGQLEKDLPMECQGLKKNDRRFVLQSLLAQKADDLLEVSAAVAGMACYSGRNLVIARSYAIPHLEALVDKHIPEDIE